MSRIVSGFGVALLLMGVVPSALWANTAQGLRITYDMAGLELTITKDAAGTLQFDGLPYVGLVLYRPQTGVVYYQHPENPVWLSVPPAVAQGFSTPARAEAGPAWQPWPAVGNMQPTRRWDVVTAPETGDGVRCQPVFGSTYAARMAGVTVADIETVLSTLEWLNSGTIAEPCNAFALGADDAEKIGLPVLMTGPNGVWKLEEVVQAGVGLIMVPENPQPIDETARLELLLVQFGPEDRAEFLKKYGELPLARQIEMVSRQLVMDAQP